MKSVIIDLIVIPYLVDCYSVGLAVERGGGLGIFNFKRQYSPSKFPDADHHPNDDVVMLMPSVTSCVQSEHCKKHSVSFFSKFGLQLR